MELNSKTLKLNDIKAEYTTVVPEPPEKSEKLLIRLQRKSYDPSNKWEAIATSGKVVAFEMNNNAKLVIKLKWCDQCWGNNFAKVRICLIDENNDVVASQVYKCPGPRPADYYKGGMKIAKTLDADDYVIDIGHGLVSRCQKGRHYVVEKIVGGVGSELHIAEFEMKSSFCWVSGCGENEGSSDGENEGSSDRAGSNGEVEGSSDRDDFISESDDSISDSDDSSDEYGEVEGSSDSDVST